MASLDLEHSDRVVCRHCGQAYRPPTWGREYLCPACARPLTGRRAAATSPSVLGRNAVCALLVLGLGAGLFRFASDRLEQNRRASIPQVETLPPVVPSEDLEGLLKQKLAVLQQDLAVEPDSSYLLWRCADLGLSLALLYRDTRPQDSAKWLKQAEEYAARLDRAVPGTSAHRELTRRLDSMPSLVWGAPAARFDSRQFRMASARAGSASGGAGASSWLRQGPTEAPRLTPAAPPTSSNGMAPAARPPGSPPEVLTPADPFPTPPPFPDPAPGPAGISARRPPADFLPRAETTPDSLRSGFPAPPPGTASSEQLLRAARQESAAANPDPKALWSLADSLAAQASVPNRRIQRFAEEQPERAALADEAIRLYLQAARLSRLRSDRATAYHDAARLHARLRRDADAYVCLKKAIEAIPFAPAYWLDLRDVTLRMGRAEESQRASVKARQWTHPAPTMPL